ncbi:MAG: helix-turn-helix domain-containing protein [Planctomycetota bacterium]
MESIARQVGFENASVFSRAFKRWVGRSPARYRE